ncbi:hypothetical protein P5V15_011727 [Pogonomyrmex californicus]
MEEIGLSKGVSSWNYSWFLDMWKPRMSSAKDSSPSGELACSDGNGASSGLASVFERRWVWMMQFSLKKWIWKEMSLITNLKAISEIFQETERSERREIRKERENCKKGEKKNRFSELLGSHEPAECSATHRELERFDG